MSQSQEDMDTDAPGQFFSAAGPPNSNYNPPLGAQSQAMNQNIPTQSEEQAMEVESSVDDMYTADRDNQEVGSSVDTDIYTAGSDNQLQASPYSETQGGQFSSQNPTTVGMPMLPITQQPLRVSQSFHLSQQTSGEAIASTADTVGFTARPDTKDSTSQLNSQEKPTPPIEPVNETSKDEMQHLQTLTPLGPQDVAMVFVQIDWNRKESSPKLEKIQIGLQSVLNKTFQCAVTIEKLILDTADTARIIISPSKACEDLLSIKSAPLKMRDSSDAVVHFKNRVPLEDPSLGAATLKQHESSIQKTHQIPMTVSVKVDTLEYGDKIANNLLDRFSQYRTEGHTLTVSGTFEEVDKFYQQFRKVVRYPVAINANTVSEQTNLELTSQEPMRVPLVQYWYLNHMHRKDIESIEQRHKVKVEADVCVSVKETPGSNSTSSIHASQEFHDLVMQHISNIDIIPVTNVIELVKDIQSLDAKLMLNGSARNWRLVGPCNEIASAQKLQGDLKNDRRLWDKAESMNSHQESRWDGPKGTEMNIDEPLLNNGICISNSHWEIMTKALKKQIKDIKNKFGVDLHENITHSDVTVTAHSTGKQIVTLEINALRALMSLYQKVVMTTMNCPLQNASHFHTEKVQKCLKELCKQNPSLVVAEGFASSGVWMMIGLPDHLRFTVREIEKKFGSSVFDKKHKDMIGYNQDIEFMKPFTDGPAWEGSKMNEGVGWAKVAASGGVYYESINGQDGQKPGGAGRKETNTLGNRKEGETEASFNGRSLNDRTAQPIGADGGETKEDDKCPICMDEFTNKEKLLCGHGFCKDCLRLSVESVGAKCPVCTKVFGKIEGDQPDGTMTTNTMGLSLPGFEQYGTIVIKYDIPHGIQTSKHPKPGRPFHGANRTAYLPNNKEGREVLALLKRAFDQKLIFTVGISRTSGSDDCVTWNDVHHKTNTHGGPQSFGYPDNNYLKRVREELKAKGIE